MIKIKDRILEKNQIVHSCRDTKTIPWNNRYTVCIHGFVYGREQLNYKIHMNRHVKVTLQGVPNMVKRIVMKTFRPGDFIDNKTQIMFIDHNTTNCALSNLIVMTRRAQNKHLMQEKML